MKRNIFLKEGTFFEIMKRDTLYIKTYGLSFDMDPFENKKTIKKRSKAIHIEGHQPACFDDTSIVD